LKSDIIGWDGGFFPSPSFLRDLEVK